MFLAVAHLLGFFVTANWVSASMDGQAPMVWALWAFIDLPWSLLYVLIGRLYSHWIEALSSAHPLLVRYLYLPYVLHGLIGTVWWFYLPGIGSKLAKAVRPKRA